MNLLLKRILGFSITIGLFSLAITLVIAGVTSDYQSFIVVGSIMIVGLSIGTLVTCFQENINTSDPVIVIIDNPTNALPKDKKLNEIDNPTSLL